ncbi:hypothetical protein C468_13281 [Halorubrum kocurii JCM 14978]|uniref:PGF-CTERM sorting domain-containing protein n=1 Tax=Halorubrum kocurii JCM 14978 TaxID=1230456 RepID=M0NR96_9EURY|nr:hypothetical protein C468_13281 [Halorubrum kocurii JCM 14978]
MAANGSLNESISVTGSGASIKSVTGSEANETLPPGDYEIAVRSEQGIATTSDDANVTLARRSTNGLTTYTGTEANQSEFESAAAVRDAIENRTLSRSERVAANDTVVYAVNATGLTGLSAARNATPETGAELDRLEGLAFGVRSAGDGDELTTSDALGETPRDATVHVDETGLYVVADGDDALPTNGGPEPGEEFTAEFRVTDDHLREAASDPPDGHRVTSMVTFDGAGRDGSTSDDPEQIGSGDPTGNGSSRADGSTGSGAGAGSEGEADGGTEGGADGGAGGGTGGSTEGGAGGGTGGEAGGIESGTGGGTGGGAGNSPSPDQAGGGPQGAPNADGAPGADENADGTDPFRGDGFGPPPSAERRTPLLDGPVAVSAPAAAEGEGPGAADASQGEASSIDGEAAGASDDETGTASGETDGAESSATGAGDAERATPTYENAPVRATAEDVPGFGPLQSLAALAAALLTAARGRRPR